VNSKPHESSSVAGQQAHPQSSVGTQHRMPRPSPPESQGSGGVGTRRHPVTDRRSVLRTFFDVTNPRKVGHEPLCGHRSRATAARTRMTAAAPATATTAKGTRHNFRSGQTSSKRTPSPRGRSRPTTDRNGGNATPSARESKKGFHTGSSSQPLFVGPSGFAQSGDESRRLLGTVAFGRADQCSAQACRWRCLHRLDALPQGKQGLPGVSDDAACPRCT
jgi:hypothetical protein